MSTVQSVSLTLRALLLGVVALLVACGGGSGGSGGGSGGISLASNRASGSFYSGEIHEFSVLANIGGGGNYSVVARDSRGNIQPAVDVQFVGPEGTFRLVFHTTDSVAPGRQRGQFEVHLCDDSACSRSFDRSTISYDFTVLSYPVPVLGSLSPASVLRGSTGIEITLTGSNFTRASVARWEGEPLETEYVSETQLVASLPDSLLTAARAVPITVRNPTPGGGTSAAMAFTVAYPVPQVSAMSAVEGAMGCGSFALRVAGQGFQPVTTVLWNGSPRSTTFFSSSLLSAEITAADLASVGTITVAARNPAPGGGTGEGQSFSITASAPPTTDTVTTNINPQHTSRATTRCPLTLPAARAWTRDVPDLFYAGYPLVADGKVYFDTPEVGRPMYALDAATGSVVWGPVAFEYPDYLAYDNGRLFAVQFKTVNAFDGATGSLVWRAPQGDAGVQSGITAVNGALYFAAEREVRALKQSDGSQLWARAVRDGDESVPAVTADSVYVSYTCFAYRLSIADGSVIWRVGAECDNDDSGSSGATPAVGDDRVFAGTGLTGPARKILRLTDGSDLGSYTAESFTVPAIAPGVRVALQDFISNPKIQAHNDDGTLRWSFERPYEDLPYSPPIIINNLVFVYTTGGTVWALDLRTGTPLWTGEPGGAPASGDNLSVGGGVLVTKRAHGLSAFDLGGRE